MNEALQESIAKLLAGSMDTLGHAKDFAIEQAPELIQQYLLWEFVYWLAIMALCIGSAVVCALCCLSLIRLAPNVESEASFVKVIVLAVLGVITFFVAIAAINLNWLHVWIAPKDYLLRAALKIKF